MLKRLINRLVLILFGVFFVWDEFDRARWVKYFKNGSF